MSKSDDDGADMEVGMTTAERRRRRRRGAGLRVPSDNVPRSRTPSTAPPAPVPEDPALAMSIAYSFTSDASGPVQRPTSDGAPIAPDAMPTVIDPPSGPVVADEFEINTREMAAVSFEQLGLTNEQPTTPFTRSSQPTIDKDIDVDMTVDEPAGGRPSFAAKPAAPAAAPRHSTVALSEDDLEDVRAASQPGRPTSQPRAQTQPPPPHQHPRAQTQPSVPPPVATVTPATANKTIPLKAIDVEIVSKSGNDEPLSMSDIDIQDLESRSDNSGEIEVDVEAEEPPQRPAQVAPVAQAAPPSRPKHQSTPPPMPLDRKSGNSLPPPNQPGAPLAATAAAERKPATSMPPPNVPAQPAAAERKPATSIPPSNAPAQPAAVAVAAAAAQAVPQAIAPTPSGSHQAPPPMPAPGAVAKPPATPPSSVAPAQQPKKPAPPAAAAAAAPVATKEPEKAEKPEKHDKPSPAKPRQWFVDLFDEDYLRTLPFLTPQATQAEAEFVANAMNLSQGAQVLDLGCGYGRHAMELAARGFHVVGLDLSTPLLVRGGEEANRRGLTINFVRGDMRELDFEAQFDACYCLFSTFGYFDDETNKKTLQNVSRALKPGGKLLVEILNRDYVIADLPTRVWWEGDGCVVLEEVELNYFSSRIIVNRSVVFDDGRQLEQEISVRAYSLHEVGKLMHAAGFRVLEVSGGYQMKGRFLGNQSRHIIVLAERKETSGS